MAAEIFEAQDRTLAINSDYQRTTFPIFISILTVLSHWNIWAYGVYALGWNTTVFWLGVVFFLAPNNANFCIRRDWLWSIPLLMMLASFSLYENPWLNTITCLVLPVSVGLLYAYSQIVNRKVRFWNLQLLKVLAMRTFSPFLSIKNASGTLLINIAKLFGQNSNAVFTRALLGIAILVPLASAVILLLGAADPNFGQLMQSWITVLVGNISWVVLLKLFCMCVLTVLLLATELAWREPIDYQETDAVRKLDEVVAGIIMCGILIIYVVFLALQVEYLIVGTLPADYRQAEHLVKSGFWQMFILSVINAGLFFLVYKNTGIIAQLILRVFIIASGLLMLSAAWRMALYIYTYGLSYEKLFASYTTLFSIFVFVYLVIASFASRRKNIIRTIVFSALWAYAVATASPVEKVIFHTNIYLSERVNSKVILSQLTQLSVDILNEVRTNILPKAQAQSKPTLGENEMELQAWRNWITRQETHACQRPWYEKNLSVLLADTSPCF